MTIVFSNSFFRNSPTATLMGYRKNTSSSVWYWLDGSSMALWGNAENSDNTNECASFGVYYSDWNKESCTRKCQTLCETAASGKIDKCSYLLHTMLALWGSNKCIFCA